jgi:archaellum biogenesis protein FlaJ (TadC family)
VDCAVRAVRAVEVERVELVADCETVLRVAALVVVATVLVVTAFVVTVAVFGIWLITAAPPTTLATPASVATERERQVRRQRLRVPELIRGLFGRASMTLIMPNGG